MKHIVLFVAIGTLLFITGCENDETKIPRLADEYCNCFANIKNEASEETMKLYERMLVRGGSEQVNAELEKLDSASNAKISGELNSISDIITGQVTGGCFTKIDKKFGLDRLFSDSANVKEVIHLLETRSECRVATYSLRILLMDDHWD